MNQLITTNLTATESSEALMISVPRVLAATGLLFGERVLGPPERYADAHLLLATIAQIYTTRDRLRRPARVVYANVGRGLIPADPYLQDPCKYLPPKFLQAAGLLLPPAPQPPVLPDETPAEPEDLEEAEPHPSLSQPVGSRSRYCAAEAWYWGMYFLRKQIKARVPKHRLDEVRLVSFEPEEGLFLAEASSNPDGDWQNPHLVKTLERLLLGVCNREVKVRIVMEGEPITEA